MTDAPTRSAPMTSPVQVPDPAHRRGRLKVYLGAMPGSGKTFAMLREGRDRRDNGEDVVIGFVETHGRLRTQEAMGTLEVVPRITVAYKGTTLTEMDLDAVLARRPQIALVDELAHTNAAGVRHPKRWKDIEELRRAGIDVITTMNIQHLETMKDVVERITGITVHETVPDAVLDAADEVQFIDITPEALRKRMRHGNVYRLDRIDTALQNFFRPGNLAALREIGLRFVAERVGTERGGVHDPPEDVVVAVSGRRSAELLIRRAVRLARRRRGLCAVLHVHKPGEDQADDAAWKRLAEELQCAVIDRAGVDVADVVISVVRDRGARHVVIGEPRARALAGLRAGVVDRVVEALPDVDVHVIAQYADMPRGPDGRADPEALLRRVAEGRAAGGTLRLYIGYARGSGATTAMLDEARRRAARGTDLVVGAVSGGASDRVGNLQVLGGARSPAWHGVLDVDALLARNPDVAAVDDLAGRTTDGLPVVDVLPRIRAAGITVIGTVHLADLRSTVETMGSLLQRDGRRVLIDDSAIDAADEVELVDIVPTELEERLRHGDIMPPAEAIQALQGEFRPEVLTALRETAFRRVAQHCDRRLLNYMSSAQIREPWEARPRVLVCVPPRPGQDRLIRRAVKLAAARDDALTAISVRRGKRTDDEKFLLGGYAALTHQLGGEFVTVPGTDVAATIADYARDQRITEIMAMRGSHRRQSRTLRQMIRLLANVDVHVLAAES